MPAAMRRRPKPSAPEAGESPDDESTESPDEQMREGSEDMPPTSKGRRGRRSRKAVKDGSCSACAAGKPCSGKKDGDTSAGPGELYNPGRKNSRMNNDALSPQEYLDACDLGIQNKPKAYIRARLDTEDALRQDFRSSTGQSQNNGSTARRVATGAAIAGGVAALAYGGHRSGAFRRAGSAMRSAAPRVRTAASSGMGKARSGFGRARSAASSGMGRARSGFATASTRARSAGSAGMKRARTGITNTSARAKSGFGSARRRLFNDSMYADGFTLDAAIFDGLIREDIKCGAGAISQGEKCTKGKTQAAVAAQGQLGYKQSHKGLKEEAFGRVNGKVLSNGQVRQVERGIANMERKTGKAQKLTRTQTAALVATRGTQSRAAAMHMIAGAPSSKLKESIKEGKNTSDPGTYAVNQVAKRELFNRRIKTGAKVLGTGLALGAVAASTLQIRG